MKRITLYSIIGALSCSAYSTSAQTWDLSGNTAILPGTDRLGTNDATPIPFFTNGAERMRLDATGNLGIGLTTPAYHLDILSPVVVGNGELQFRARSAEDPAAWMSILNASAIAPGLSIPALHGEQSSNSPNAAFTTIGNIDPSQDLGIATNPDAVNRFFASQGWIPNSGGVDRLNVINNRRIFDWMNGPDRLMTMMANGNVGLARGNPGNRLEINSDFYGVGMNPLPLWQQVFPTTPNGHPQVPGLNPPTGFSGLRFSVLTSASVPELNPSANVFSVDLNGDVILVPGGGVGNCPAPLVLNTDGAIDLNGNDFFFLAPNSAEQVAIGIPCGTVPVAKLTVSIA